MKYNSKLTVKFFPISLHSVKKIINEFKSRKVAFNLDLYFKFPFYRLIIESDIPTINSLWSDKKLNNLYFLKMEKIETEYF